MKPKPDGTLPYKGLVDCFATTVKNEGFGRLWVGVNTYLLRVAPHAVISLIINEFVRNMLMGNNAKPKEKSEKLKH